MPAVLEVTLTKIVQLVLAGRVPFEKMIDVPPTATLSTPPQLFVNARGGPAITSPVGKLSVKARPVRGVAVLLVMVNVKNTGVLAREGTVGNVLAKTS